MVIADIVKGIFDGAVKPILDKAFTDAKDRLDAELLFYKQMHEINLAQIGVNKEEASSQSLFVSGWRPFVGWVCGGGFAYSIVGHDFLNWVLSLANGVGGYGIPLLPKPDLTMLFELLLGLLGLGAYRTYEKVNGVASK